MATRILLSISIVLSCFAGCSQRKHEIKIGVILPLTGGAAVYGQAIKNGMELARSEDSVASPNRIVSPKYQDDQSLPASSVSAAHNLIDIEKVPAIIGGAMSSTAEAIIPLCEASKIVLLSPTATEPSLTKEGGYFLRLWPSDDYDGKVMAEIAYNKLNLRGVSIVYINVAYGVGITQVFEHEFRKLGGKIVSEDGYNQNATDFRAILSKVKTANPEAIYLPGYVNEIGQILKQVRELKINAKILGVNSLYDPKLIEIAGPAAEGAVFTYPTFDLQSQDTIVTGFIAKYTRIYGAKPDAFAAQGYDSWRVIRTAIAKINSGEVTGKGVLKALHELGAFSGPSGVFQFDTKGDVQKPLRLLTVRDGKFENMQ